VAYSDMKKYFIKTTGLFTLLAFAISCKKDPIEPVFIEEKAIHSKFIYPVKIEIEDSVSKSLATIHVEYTSDKKVKKITRELNVANPTLDSTFEISYKYIGDKLLSMKRSIEYLPSGSKPSHYTEVNFTYKEGRYYTCQRITNHATQDLDTTTFFYFTLLKSDGSIDVKKIKTSDSVYYRASNLKPDYSQDDYLNNSYSIIGIENRYYLNERIDFINGSVLYDLRNDTLPDMLKFSYRHTLENLKDSIVIKKSIFEAINILTEDNYEVSALNDIGFSNNLDVKFPNKIYTSAEYYRNRSVDRFWYYALTKLSYSKDVNGKLTEASLSKHKTGSFEWSQELEKLQQRNYRFYY
jgi:hypothetical protein